MLGRSHDSGWQCHDRMVCWVGIHPTVVVGVGATVLVTFENIMRHSRVDCQRGEGPDLCKILIDKQLNTINNIETERMRNWRDTIESE